MARKEPYSEEQRNKILAALAANDGNINRTAGQFGISRKTLREWREKYGLPAVAPLAPAPAADADLTDLQRAFIEHYLSNGFNATRAAIAAGYSEKSARQMGSENLSKPYIRRIIDDRLAAVSLSANQVLAVLSDHATASLEDFVSIEDGRTPTIDLHKAKRLGRMHLLKKIKFNQLGLVESIELHDPQPAAVHLGRHHKLFTDRVEVVDWRKELEDAGVDAGSAFQHLVDKLVADLRASSGADVAGGAGRSQAAA